jgi:hypothetical protein
MPDVLITWVGSRDPIWQNHRTGRREPGPIISLLRSRHFDVVYLLLNILSKGEDYAERATGVLRACQKEFPTIAVHQKLVDVVSVTDYKELYRSMNDVCQAILQDAGRDGQRYFLYLSPGTPQMQAVWILLAEAGLIPGRLITATPPDLLAPGVPVWHEVDFSFLDLPQLRSPGERSRTAGVLQAQNDNLRLRVLTLESNIAALQITPTNNGGSIPEGFRLREYLCAVETSFYIRALDLTDSNAAAAASLLGIEPAAFRARAETLGLRARRKRRT